MNKFDLYNGDCLDVMNELPDGCVDMVLCDLPYGSTFCSWDVVLPFDKLWECYNRVAKKNCAILLFGQEPFASFLRLSNIKNYKYDLYWRKESFANFMQVKRRFGKTVETISVFYQEQPTYNPQFYKHTGKPVSNKYSENNKRFKSITAANSNGNLEFYEYKDNGLRYPKDVLEFGKVSKRKLLHPTQKPVELLKYLIKTYTNEGDIVLDNCMGSGSTGVACADINRNFIGIEKEQTYFDIARERIKEANNKLF